MLGGVLTGRDPRCFRKRCASSLAAGISKRPSGADHHRSDGRRRGGGRARGRSVLIALDNREDLIGLHEANRDRVLVSAGEILGSRRSLLMEDQPTQAASAAPRAKITAPATGTNLLLLKYVCPNASCSMPAPIRYVRTNTHGTGTRREARLKRS